MISRCRYRGIIFMVLLLSVLVCKPLTGVPPLSAQEPEIDPVRELMLLMPPEVKIGQLVMVSFPGTDISEDSDITQLIRDYSIGGLLYTRENGNFSSYSISATELLSTTTFFQNYALSSMRVFTMFTSLDSDVPFSVPFFPLLIATRPENGIYPTAFITEASRLATPLAIGATWNLHLAMQSGEVLGRELSALGFNLYLGPDLDVLYTPSPGDPADLGTQVFGADPFWVGEMGRAFVSGLHHGGSTGLLVAPRHLPGLGSADRTLDEEVPTVQKPLEQLKQIELAPFFTVARNEPSNVDAADAFLVTHIKYRGFQGNIRQTTRPISLDAQALKSVYTLEEMALWRTSGGVLIADNLGLPAVHLSYDPRGLTFNSRRVAQDALIAGNDLLLLDRFSANGDWNDHFSNVRDTLEYLSSRYKEDPAFRTVVDAAVYRVLTMKLRIVPVYKVGLTGDLAENELSLGVLGQTGEVNSQVAQESLTRIFPLTEDLLPSPPQASDSIVIFTQEKFTEVTSDLFPIPLLQRDDISDAILRLYGPDGTGVVRFNLVRSFTFEDLTAALNQLAGEGGVPVSSEEGQLTIADVVLAALRDARWVVFASTGLTDAVDSLALKRFLATQANVIDAHLAVFSFGPPYELDSTDVTKLDLYYALYSTGPAFVDAAARALFRDIVSPGASPVDIPAVNYFLPDRTMPEAAQVISLFLVNEAGEELTATTRSNIHIGDSLFLRTGTILDRNGHAVPDNTPVQFYLTYPQESIERTLNAESSLGIAETSLTLDRVGQLHIAVKSEPAISSLRLELTIRDDGVTITEVEPSPTPTPTPQPTITPSPEPTATPTLVPFSDHQLPAIIALPELERAPLLIWGLGSILGMGVLAFLWFRDQSISPEDALRLALHGIISGIIVYLICVVLTRWVLPASSYALIGREYWFGIAGVIGTLIELSISYLVHRKYTLKSAQASSTELR